MREDIGIAVLSGFAAGVVLCVALAAHRPAPRQECVVLEHYAEMAPGLGQVTGGGS